MAYKTLLEKEKLPLTSICSSSYDASKGCFPQWRQKSTVCSKEFTISKFCMSTREESLLSLYTGIFSCCFASGEQLLGDHYHSQKKAYGDPGTTKPKRDRVEFFGPCNVPLFVFFSSLVRK